MDSSYKTTPFIRLQGKWLESVGFTVGSKFIAEIKNDKIILKRQNINA